MKARLGDDPESPVRFDIAIKNAEIVFVIPQNEPLQVLQATVKRENPLSVKSKTKHESESGGSASISVGADAKTMALTASGALSASAKTTVSESKEIERNDGHITWAQSRGSDGSYRWAVAPTTATILLGKAWDAVSEPLLQVKNSSNTATLDAVCRVEIWCRREDIAVTNLVAKGDNVLSRLLPKINEHKIAAAEAYIRNALVSLDLDIRNFEDPYGHVKLADVLVDEQTQ